MFSASVNRLDSSPDEAGRFRRRREQNGRFAFSCAGDLTEALMLLQFVPSFHSN